MIKEQIQEKIRKLEIAAGNQQKDENTRAIGKRIKELHWVLQKIEENEEECICSPDKEDGKSVCGIECDVHKEIYEKGVRDGSVAIDAKVSQEFNQELHNENGKLVELIKHKTREEIIEMLEDAFEKLQGGGNARRLFIEIISKIKEL